MKHEHGLQHAGYDHLAMAYYRECFCGSRYYGPDHRVTIEPFNEHIDDAIGEDGHAFARWATGVVNQPLFAAAFWAALRGIAFDPFEKGA